MLSRLLWKIITPRQLRRITLVTLLVWTAAAFADHRGTFDDMAEHLPRQVQVNTNWGVDRGFPSSVHAPRTGERTTDTSP